ncbi:MAG: DUF4199 domain-containing protein [Alistipes sp.]|nr:DUF4199 domain-containing protein [Alistipes sp.]
MKTSVLWNDILTKGAILGGVMLASNIAETSMLIYGGTIGWMGAMSIECLAVMALYCYLIYRFTSNYANLVVSERKEMPYFTYGNGYSYAVMISILAGVITALGSHIFLNYVVGYDNYVTATINIAQSAISQAELPSAMVGQYEQMLSAIQQQEAPSIMNKLFGSIWTYLLAGSFVGLIVAAFTKREPQMFDNQNEQNDEQ